MWPARFSVVLAFLAVHFAQCTLFPEECGGHPCLNGGECYFSFDEQLGDQFNCRCPEPYYGTYCEKVRNPTESESNITTFGLTASRREYNQTTEISPTTDKATDSSDFTTNRTGPFSTTLVTENDEVGNLTESEPKITTVGFTPTRSENNLTTEYYLTTDQEDDKTGSTNTTATFFTTPTTTLVTLKDPCSDKPCENGGICQVEGSTYKCYCPTPFTGRTCSKGPCSDSPCKNEGICAVKGNSYACYCQHPFTGRNCEIDPCSANPCENGGICKVEGSSFKCKCKPSYYGLRCEKDTCYKNPCKNGGICKANGYRFKCYCSSPFSGSLCEKGPCSGNPCKNNGICEVKGTSHVCYCRSPYTGKSCEITPCTNKPCMNNGTCIVYGDSYKCYCKRPYFGDLCQQDACTVNPCQNNGTCEVNGKSFTCNCKEPFTGKLCDEILTSSTNPTTESEAIITTPIPEKCECTNGYCVTSAKGVECVCNPGFGKNPNGYCEECHCGEKFNCTFEKRWFTTYKTCICPKGYEEVNEKCVDACSFSPCENGGTCRLTNDSYMCDCPEAFTGRRCQIEKCSSANCKNGKCITNEKGKTKCVCNPGFAKNPDGYCQECHCGEQFNCTFGKRWFTTYKTCMCPKGYEEVNEKCVDACSFSPCENGGTCRLTNDSYVCDCPEAFTGKRCHIEKCSSANCKNGKCITNEKGKTKCVCNPGFAKHPDGHCQACNCGKKFNCTFAKHWFVTSKVCNCPNGYEEVKGKCRDPCYYKPCWNGGTCKLTNDSYRCECPKEFTGTRCERRKCNCENGKCIKSGKNYKCVCNSDYGIYSTGVCKACNCGKNSTCTFDRGVFWDKIYCACPEGFSMVNKECIKTKTL